MHRVQSTYKIIWLKAFDHNVDESWVDWAIEMVEAGFESKNLYMLAGSYPPFNQFEMKELTTAVMRDLSIEYSDKYTAIRNYSYFLIKNAVNNPEIFFSTLYKLRGFYYELDHDDLYGDFYFLYYAKDDLLVDENQWYWDGANRDNIDTIIKERFIQWIEEFERNYCEKDPSKFP